MAGGACPIAKLMSGARDLCFAQREILSGAKDDKGWACPKANAPLRACPERSEGMTDGGRGLPESKADE